jgi:hypothetical protein
MFFKNNRLSVGGAGLVSAGAAAFFVISFMAGCAKYSAQPLRSVNTINPRDMQEDSGKKPEKSISLAYHAFDKNDCKTYLGRDVLAKGYQPVQVSITNNSDRYINIAKSNFSLPSVPALDVAKKVHTSTITRATCYGVAGLFLWPFLIPAVVDGMKSSEANHRLDDDFSRKEFPDQIVAPFNTVSGLIFVPKNEFNPYFTVTAVDVEKRVRFVLNSYKPYLKI